MKSYIKVIALFVIAFQLAGCTGVQRKFTRKKATTKEKAVMYFSEGAYEREYSNEYYYKLHFTLWQTWHKEALANIGGNSKKFDRSLQESYSHLSQMAVYLEPQKSAPLNAMAIELSRLIQKVKRETLTDANRSPVRSALESIQRRVAAEFHHGNMKDYILSSSISTDVSAQQEAQNTATTTASSTESAPVNSSSSEEFYRGDR